MTEEDFAMDDEKEMMTSETSAKPKYEAPMVRVMNESEVLSAFQVTAAGTGASMWWVA